LFQTFIVWPTAADAERPVAAGRQHLVGALILTAAAVLLGTIVATSFRVLEIKGDGMAPTALDGDRLICRMGVDRRDLKNGALILFRCSDQSRVTTAGDHMLGRIIASPGDEIEIKDGYFFVNGTSVHPAGSIGPDIPALTIPVAPQPGQEKGRVYSPARVELDKYFVVQDSLDSGRDSRVLSWAELENIKSSQMFSLSRGFLPRRLE
jgi:signal peptidase I